MVKKYPEWYFATVGRYTGRTILNNAPRFGRDGIVLLPSEATLDTAKQIIEELRKNIFDLQAYIVMLDAVKLWNNVNRILKKVKIIYESISMRKINTTFDISGGTRIMTIAAHIAASAVATTKLVKNVDIIYTFEDEAKKDQVNPFTTDHLPQIKIRLIMRKERVAILKALKHKRLTIRQLEVAVKGEYNKNRKGPTGSIYDHANELEKYGLVKRIIDDDRKEKRTLTDEGEAFLEILDIMYQYGPRR